MAATTINSVDAWGGVQQDDGHFISIYVNTAFRKYSFAFGAARPTIQGTLSRPSAIEGGAHYDVAAGSIDVWAPNTSEPQGAIAFTLNGVTLTRRGLVSGGVRIS